MTEARWSTFWSDEPSGPDWCHTGIAVLDSGAIAFGAPEQGLLIVIDELNPGGRRIRTALTELHGICAYGSVLWIADPGIKPDPLRAYEWIESVGRAVAVDLNGGVLAELEDPHRSGRAGAPWRPTSIAVVPDGPLQGYVWVADGYGASLLHLFDPVGALVRSIDGTESGTAFSCPHGLLVATMSSQSLLLVADRRNRRIVRMTTSGDLVDTLSDELIRSPSCLASGAGRIVLTELDGALLGLDDRMCVFELVARGARLENPQGWPERPGWPNILVGESLQRPPLQVGLLNSPHGVAVGPNGEVHVTEWVIGGRFVTILPTTPTTP